MGDCTKAATVKCQACNQQDARQAVKASLIYYNFFNRFSLQICCQHGLLVLEKQKQGAAMALAGHDCQRFATSSVIVPMLGQDSVIALRTSK